MKSNYDENLITLKEKNTKLIEEEEFEVNTKQRNEQNIEENKDNKVIKCVIL